MCLDIRKEQKERGIQMLLLGAEFAPPSLCPLKPCVCGDVLQPRPSMAYIHQVCRHPHSLYLLSLPPQCRAYLSLFILLLQHNTKPFHCFYSHSINHILYTCPPIQLVNYSLSCHYKSRVHTMCIIYQIEDK